MAKLNMSSIFMLSLPSAASLVDPMSLIFAKKSLGWDPVMLPLLVKHSARQLEDGAHLVLMETTAADLQEMLRLVLVSSKSQHPYDLMAFADWMRDLDGVPDAVLENFTEVMPAKFNDVMRQVLSSLGHDVPVKIGGAKKMEKKVADKIEPIKTKPKKSEGEGVDLKAVLNDNTSTWKAAMTVVNREVERALSWHGLKFTSSRPKRDTDEKGRVRVHYFIDAAHADPMDATDLAALIESELGDAVKNIEFVPSPTDDPYYVPTGMKITFDAGAGSV
jgi:hypothetical protein